MYQFFENLHTRHNWHHAILGTSQAHISDVQQRWESFLCQQIRTLLTQVFSVVLCRGLTRCYLQRKPGQPGWLMQRLRPEGSTASGRLATTIMNVYLKYLMLSKCVFLPSSPIKYCIGLHRLFLQLFLKLSQLCSFVCFVF